MSIHKTIGIVLIVIFSVGVFADYLGKTSLLRLTPCDSENQYYLFELVHLSFNSPIADRDEAAEKVPAMFNDIDWKTMPPQGEMSIAGKTIRYDRILLLLTPGYFDLKYDLESRMITAEGELEVLDNFIEFKNFNYSELYLVEERKWTFAFAIPRKPEYKMLGWAEHRTPTPNSFALTPPELLKNIDLSFKGDVAACKKMRECFRFSWEDQYRYVVGLYMGALLQDKEAQRDLRQEITATTGGLCGLLCVSEAKQRFFEQQPDSVFAQYCLFLHYHYSGDQEQTEKYKNLLRTHSVPEVLLSELKLPEMEKPADSAE